MKVKKLMTADCATCAADSPVAEAAKIMWKSDCGIVPVLEEGNIVGVVTDRDICMAALMSGLPLGLIRVNEVMTTEVSVCEADDEATAAHATMRESQIRRLPVVDEEGALVGMISLSDLANEAYAGRSKAAAKRQRDVGRSFASISEPHPAPEADEEESIEDE